MRPLPGERRQHADEDDQRHDELDQPAIGRAPAAAGTCSSSWAVRRHAAPAQTSSSSTVVAAFAGRADCRHRARRSDRRHRLRCRNALSASRVGVLIAADRVRAAAVGVAGVARRLRGFGRGAAEIVHLAHHVAEALDAVPLERRRRRSRVQQPLARARLASRARRGGVARLAGCGRSGSAPAARRVAARRGRHRPARGGRGAAAAAAGRLAGSARALRAASASTLRMASSSARRSLVISDSDSGGSTRAQLRHQRGARPFIKRPSSFARASFKTFHGAGDERMIVGHRLSLRSPL